MIGGGAFWPQFGVILTLGGVILHQWALRLFNGLRCFETWHDTCFIHFHQRRIGQTIAERLARRLLLLNFNEGKCMSTNDLLELQLKQLGRMIQLKRRPSAKYCFYVIFSDGPTVNLIDKLLQIDMSQDVREFLLVTKKAL